ncbi:LTA synthase family protein [Flavihumibacter sp. CACIAM 22H1]|uniref:LTA synthase family protein n=1 Tax=Flavihumibacter sp. CACIAM 22H1 TaxID=1812911 RepID=UPI0007A80823|nr:LTA synthase family protein [Flavihumibacter sp. CACIAM 22H1]KYP14844.1 MAG: hypothetical protein A1D16_03975 [Flavihumibacter sp. CACIAM 22H1]
METITYSIRSFILFYLFLLLNKLIFFCINYASFSLDRLSDGFSIIAGSFYYDFWVLFFFWLLNWAVRLIKNSHPTGKAGKIAELLMVLVVFGYILFSVSGALFYKFNFELPSNRTLSIMWDNRHFTGVYLRQYSGYLLGLLLALATVIYFIFRKKSHTQAAKQQVVLKRKTLVISVLLFFLTGVYLTREKIGSGWLSPNSSFRFVKPRYYNLVINPFFNFGYSYLKQLNTSDLFIDLLETELPPVEQPVSGSKEDTWKGFGQFRGKNIFLLIIESASAENFDESSPSKFEMPFFDSLKNHSLFFSNAYANGYLSSEGVKAIYLGIGNHIMEKRVKHPYIKDRLYLANLLSGAGYTSSFFYSNDSYAADYWKAVGYAGVRNYYTTPLLDPAYKHLPEQELPDHVFFPLVAEKMNSFEEPFFSGISNVSTHNPYTRFPGYEQYKNKALPFSQAASMRYLDDVLRDFFHRIQANTWFKNTIFLFVGDHYSRAEDLLNRSDWGLLQIPLMIYAPGENLIGKADYPVQQADIPSTILEMVGIPDAFTPAGRNIIGPVTSQRQILTRKGNLLLFANDSLFLSYDMLQRRPVGCWNYRKDPGLKSEITPPALFIKDFFTYLGGLKQVYRPLTGN